MQQRDGGGNDAFVVEDRCDVDGAGAHVGIVVLQQLDHRLDQVLGEGAQRLERALAHESGQRFRELDVAAQDRGRIADGHEDGEHGGAGGRFARGDEREEAVGEADAGRLREARQTVHDDLLRRGAGARQLAHQRLRGSLGGARGEHFERLVAHGAVGIGRQLHPSMQRRLPHLGRAELVQKRQALVGAADRRLLPEELLHPAGDRRLEQQPLRRVVQRRRRGQHLRQPRIEPGDGKGEERAGGGAHGLLGLVLGLGEERVDGLGVEGAGERAHAALADGAVGAEEHPRQVLRPQPVGGLDAGEHLVALLLRGEALVGEFADDLADLGLEDGHGTAASLAESRRPPCSSSVLSGNSRNFARPFRVQVAVYQENA